MREPSLQPHSLLAAQVLASARAGGYSDYLLERPLVVGVSGGADSLALLHLLVELRGDRARRSLHVAHLDHGFRGDAAADDARFVAPIAEQLGLDYTVARADVPAFATEHRLSTEDAARRVRYAFLASVASKHSAVVAVAHTADDQAETVMLHMMRGSGLGGLGGMRPVAPLRVDSETRELFPIDRNVSTELYRPLLGVWRSQVEEHCQHLHLTPRTDATNTDTRFRRNLIRLEVLPALERASPGFKERLLRLSGIARGDDEALDWAAASASKAVLDGDPATGQLLVNAAELRLLPEGLQRRVVRQALAMLAGGLQDIEFAHVYTALRVITGADGAPRAADLPRGVRVTRQDNATATLNRVQDLATANARADADSAWPLLPPGTLLALRTGEAYALDRGWSLRVDRLTPDSLPGPPGPLRALFAVDELPAGPLYLRTRRRGDFIRPLGMSGTKSLQDLCVDAKIPGALRERLALITLSDEGGEVLWVPGPGGRRSRVAPLIESTTRVLCLQFEPRENI